MLKHETASVYHRAALKGNRESRVSLPTTPLPVCRGVQEAFSQPGSDEHG